MLHQHILLCRVTICVRTLLHTTIWNLRMITKKVENSWTQLTKLKLRCTTVPEGGEDYRHHLNTQSTTTHPPHLQHSSLTPSLHSLLTPRPALTQLARVLDSRLAIATTYTTRGRGLGSTANRPQLLDRGARVSGETYWPQMGQIRYFTRSDFRKPTYEIWSN